VSDLVAEHEEMTTENRLSDRIPPARAGPLIGDAPHVKWEPGARRDRETPTAPTPARPSEDGAPAKRAVVKVKRREGGAVGEHVLF
jgi:hypothetical protein